MGTWKIIPFTTFFMFKNSMIKKCSNKDNMMRMLGGYGRVGG